MKKDIQQDLIERYLNGALSEAEQQDVERRLAADAAFRNELALQRAIQQHLGNPAELRLRSALDNMWQEIASGQTQEHRGNRPTYKVWRPYVAAAAAVVLLIAAWWWLQPLQSIPEEPLTAQQTLRTPDSIPEPLQHDPQQTLPRQNTIKRPIAMANPADFAPNPTLDVRIGSVRGDGDGGIDLLSPAPESKFQLENGQITMTIRGTINTDSLPANQPFRLFIYSNRPEDWEKKHALFDLAFPMEQVEQGQYKVYFKQSLALKPGLYYIQIGQLRSLQAGSGYKTVWVGKFTANAKK